jgi:hypothetical protein
MIITTIWVNKQRVGIDVILACAFDTTVSRLALVQVTICIVPKDAITYIRL